MPAWLALIPWKLIAKVLYTAVRPLIVKAVEASETKVDDKFFSTIDKVVSGLLGANSEQDKQIKSLVESEKRVDDNASFYIRG